LSLRILPLRAGAGCERYTPDNHGSERQTPSSLWNLRIVPAQTSAGEARVAGNLFDIWSASKQE